VSDIMEVSVTGLTHVKEGDSFTAVRHGGPARKDCQLMEHFIEVVNKEIKYRMMSGKEFNIIFEDKADG